MELFGIIAAIIIVFLIAFILGAIGMAKWKNKNQTPPIEKPETKNTLYADRVIYIAGQIYCNYSESKIIRPGQSAKLKKDRYGEALQEALNLVGAANHYFDLLDSDSKKPAQKPNTKDIKIN